MPPSTPEEVLRFIAAELERAGRHFAEGVEVECEPLFDGLPPGPEYAAVNVLLHEMYEDGILMFRTHMGPGHPYGLTSRGAALARRIYLPQAEREALLRIGASRIEGRRDAFQRGLGEAIGRLAARGLRHSSVAVAEIRRMAIEELEARLRIVLDIWRSAAVRKGFELGREWAELTREALDQLVVASQDLAELYRVPLPRFDGGGETWEDVAARIRARVDAEVDAALHLDEANIGGNIMAEEINVQHIHGPVGAAQVGGAGNRARVEQHTGQIDYGAGTQRLQELVSILERADGGPAAAEALEAAQLALEEVRKGKPNRVALGGILSGLHHAIAAVNAWPGALEAVRAAGVALGFPLPG